MKSTKLETKKEEHCEQLYGDKIYNLEERTDS